jgi:hypothetical protein
MISCAEHETGNMRDGKSDKVDRTAVGGGYSDEQASGKE